MNKDVIIACDFPSMEQTLSFLEAFRSRKPYVKVGMELFYAAGPQMVRALKQRGHRVFLDLKLHDIPTTVRRAMCVLRDLGADMVNLHAAGARQMMEAAREGLTRPDGSRPLLLAVTQLTSTSQAQLEDELLIREPIASVVTRYARNARDAGLDGVVCAPLEASAVKDACGASFLTVTPGIRFADAAADDQTRVATPAKARAYSDFIVVGRPITAAADPVAAYEQCVKEFLS